eukprot:1132825-Amphidinium_carterae.1
MKEVKKMLAAVVEAENVIQQTMSMQSNMQYSVRDMNAGLSEVGCIAAPMCLMGHDMVWRPVEKEGKVFCDRCAAPRSARQGVIPYVWRCELCVRDLSLRFHYCKDCGDSIRNEMVVQKCQPVEDWDYLVRVANEALTETQQELGVEAAENTDVAETLREIRDAQQRNLQGSLSRQLSKRRPSAVSRRASVVSAAEPDVADEPPAEATRRSSRRGLEEDKRKRVSMMLDTLSRQESKFPSELEEAPQEADGAQGDTDLAAGDTGMNEAVGAMEKRRSLVATLSHVPPLVLDDNLSHDSSSESPVSSTETSQEGDDSDAADTMAQGQHRRPGLLGLVNLKICARRLLTFVRKDANEEEKVEAMAEVEEPEEAPPPRPTPRPPRPRPVNPPSTAPIRRIVTSESEQVVAHLRKEVLALNSPRRPKKVEPLEHMLAGTNVLRVMLPPLQPIKAYVPWNVLPEEPPSLPPVTQTPVLDPWQSPRDLHKAWKVSTLGHTALHLQRSSREQSGIVAHLGLSPRLTSEKQSQGISRAAKESESELLVRQSWRDGLMNAPKMDAWTPQCQVRGRDPLAGACKPLSCLAPVQNPCYY